MNEPVVIWNGSVHSGLLHSFAENGGEVGLGDGCSIRFARNGAFINLQVLHYGKGIKPATTSWKAPKPKKQVKTLEMQEEVSDKKAW